MSYLHPPPEPAPIVVVKDVGGLVSDYRDRTALYRVQNREVRLHECRSACTLALSLPKVCVFPTSTLKFHQAYNQITNETDLGITDELWQSYPQAVRARLGTLTRQYKVIRGSELIALGVRDCAAPQGGTMIARTKPMPQQPQKESGTLLASLGQTLSSFMTPAPVPAVAAKPVLTARSTPEGAKPPVEPPKPVPEPPPRPTEPIPSVEAELDVPLPPPRPPLVAQADPPAPSIRQPITGSQPILSPQFAAVSML